ncbi:predicted protein [Botrytis cinerea T4]|uniref:Uncharacterized protein n=1 Tax=Botryotinia fuckeliana (strain T4) TaxID=999810 RepID=G2YEQ0_BOTF4|nr:predicted protein [Botrytis cinerea T4]
MFIIQDSDVCSRFRVPGLNSNASRQYMEQVPGEQRHLQEVAAAEDTGKRTVKRNDGTHDVFIEQIIVEDFVPADQWDTENIAIFNLQTVNIHTWSTTAVTQKFDLRTTIMMMEKMMSSLAWSLSVSQAQKLDLYLWGKGSLA